MIIYEFKSGDPDTFTQDSVIKYNENGSFLCIPCNMENSDYQAYLKWAEENNG